MQQAVAWVFVAVTAGLAVFQLALASGAPLGRFAWGGQHVRPPAGLRIGSLVSIVIYCGCAAVILDRAGVVDVVDDGISRTGAWVVAGLLSLGVAMNAISRSRPERFTMTPVAFAMAASAFVVAAS